MNTLVSTIVVSSIIVLGGCQKTNRAANTKSSPEVLVNQTQDHEVEATLEENVLVLNINGEEQVIDLSEMVGDIDLDSMDGSMEFHVNLEADSLEDIPEGIQQYIKKMIGEHGGDMDEAEITHQQIAAWLTQGSEHGTMRMRGGEHDMHDMDSETLEHIMEMMRQGFHVPEGMNPLNAHRRNDVRGEHGNPEGGVWIVEGPSRGMLMGGPEQNHQTHAQRDERNDRDVPEEVEFMDKVRMYYEVAEHLAETEAMALLGVHMLRDGVEPEMRFELLDELIDELPDGDAARNAAILVAIETLRELGEEEEAASLIIELILSNSNVDEEYWDDEEWEEEEEDDD